jgi:hypothetical protein
MTQLNADVTSVILEYADYFKQAVLFDILFPGCRKKCYKRNLIEENNIYGTLYKLFGKLHREGKPAEIWTDGSQRWYFNNKPHRDGNMPAIILTHMYTKKPDNNTPYIIEYVAWYYHGQLHRDYNLPAIIHYDGKKCWYIDGVFIRRKMYSINLES